MSAQALRLAMGELTASELRVARSAIQWANTANHALVRAEEREKLAAWMIRNSYSTGHGDSIEDLLKELGEEIRDNNAELVKALKEIAENKYCIYSNTRTSYGTGVTDGHRFCAKIAKEALASIIIP